MNKKLHCASCGRFESTNEDGVIPILCDGRKWCPVCSDIGEIERRKFVNMPSPGLMIEGDINDSLAAWDDCYSKKPKKRILKNKAKAEIQRAWSIWDGDKNNNMAMFSFFAWLTRHRPYFLTFRCKGDPWQTVHSWLLQYERETKNK